MRAALVAAALVALAVLPAVPVAAQAEERVGAVQLFARAGEAEARGDFAAAETMYRALGQDPDPQYRAEARFRLARMFSSTGRTADAAVLLRALLDEQPDAAPVRVELARLLALMGDEAGARRELRQVRAGELPPDIVLAIDQFAAALRATRPFGGSLQFAIIPDSNVNRATRSTTIDTIIAPLDLSEDARARAGIGVRLGGTAFARVPVAPALSLVPRLSSQTDLYADGRFNDATVAGQLGLDATLGPVRLQPSLGASIRWYGGDPFVRTTNAAIAAQMPLSPRAQLVADAGAARLRFDENDLQDGDQYSLSLGIERAFDTVSGGSLSLSAARQTARDPGYANAGGGVSALYYRDLGRTTLFGALDLRLLEGDARLFLFPERRSDRLIRASLGATFRTFTVLRWAPLVRVSVERNWSTLELYDYARQSVELGITRAF